MIMRQLGSMTNEEYKRIHEEFVSNLTGSSISTLLITLLHTPILILLSQLVTCLLYPNDLESIKKLNLETVLFIIPNVIILTVFAKHLRRTHTHTQACSSHTHHVTSQPACPPSPPATAAPRSTHPPQKKKVCLSLYHDASAAPCRTNGSFPQTNHARSH